MLKLIEDKHTLTDPVYLKSAVSYDWEEFKELDKWEAVQRVVRGVKGAFAEVFELAKDRGIDAIRPDFSLEPFVKWPEATYADYEEGEDGKWRGVGEPTGMTKLTVNFELSFIGGKCKDV